MNDPDNPVEVIGILYRYNLTRHFNNLNRNPITSTRFSRNRPYPTKHLVRPDFFFRDVCLEFRKYFPTARNEIKKKEMHKRVQTFLYRV